MPGKPPQQQQLKEAQAQLAKQEAQIARLIDIALQGGELTGKYLEERLRKLEADKQRAEELVLKLQSQAAHAALPPQPRELPLLWPQLNTRQQHELANIFIDKILLDASGMRIYWQYHLR